MENATSRKGFVFYMEFLKIVRALPAEEQLPIFRAIAEYGLCHNEPSDFGPIGRVVWIGIKERLDWQWSKALGGMANAGKPCPAKLGNRNAAKSRDPAAPPSPDSTGNDGGGAPSRKRFVPPSVEEVASYAREEGLTMDAAAFVDYYASNGWKVGKGAMKDWRPAVRNWARRDERDRARVGRAPGAPSKQPPIDLYRDDDDL